jgi:hypothetical protein
MARPKRDPLAPIDHVLLAQDKLLEAWRALDVAQYHLFCLPVDKWPAETSDAMAHRAIKLRDELAALKAQLDLGPTQGTSDDDSTV